MINRAGVLGAVRSIQNKDVFVSPISVSSNLNEVYEKSDWNVQNEGAYDLIFPYLHVDFPTREEMVIEINKAMAIYNIHTNPPLGVAPPPQQFTPLVAIELVPAEKPGVAGLERVKVRAKSKVKSYGV